jgi:sporulation protein YlmC with PRC-barrel domain
MSSHPTTVAPTMPTSNGALISSERVTGTNVYNREGEKLGSVEAMMIDKMSGQVRFAVMSFGGFLGMGEKYHQLPWNGLTYDLDQEGYVVNLSRDALNAAPVFSRDEIDSFDYGDQSTSIDSYYGKIDGFQNRPN